MLALVPLPIALPLLVAAVLGGAGSLAKRGVADAIAAVTALSVTVICGILLLHCSPPIVYWFGGWHPRGGAAIGIGFTIDPFAAGMATFASAIVTAALFYSWSYFNVVRTLYHALMLVFLAAMAGFCLTGDLFNMFVLFELMSVTAFALAGFKIEDQSLQGAFNFAITNSVAAFMVLIGIGLLYGRTGALNMAQIGATLTHMGQIDALVICAFVLILTGFLIKSAAVPFHFWLPDAHAVAPTPVCMLFSGVMVELGLYGIARTYWTIFAPLTQPHAGHIRAVLLGFAVATVLVGAVMCFAQRHIKRLLAFSSVSHMGTVLAGLAILRPGALSGAALYLTGHGMIKAALFAITGLLLARFGSVDEFDLHHAGRKKPFSAAIFVVAALALAGMPPFGLWLGKALIDDSADQAGAKWLSYVFLFGAALTGGAVLRVAGRVFAGLGRKWPAGEQGTPGREERESKPIGQDTPSPMIVPAFCLLAIALAVALLPHLSQMADTAAERFCAPDAYYASTLAGNASPWLSISAVIPHPGLYGKRLAEGIISTLLALAVAGLALEGERIIPVGLRNAWIGIAGLPLRALRAVHSGDPRDYVTWIVVGTALLGGLSTLAVR